MTICYRRECFDIDGETFTPKEFVSMLGPYHGFSIQYQIHDASVNVLYKNEILTPVNVGRDFLLMEFDALMVLYAYGNGLREENEAEFEDEYKKLVDRIYLAKRSSCRDLYDKAAEVGKVMLHRIKKLKCRDQEMMQELIRYTEGAIDE